MKRDFTDYTPREHSRRTIPNQLPFDEGLRWKCINVLHPLGPSFRDFRAGFKEKIPVPAKIIARALLSRPKTLIMDESTSGGDDDTDSRVQRRVKAELEGCMWIVIAHNLSSVIDSDQIAKEGVFAQGVKQSGELALLASFK